jgi:hypothetical protein
MERKTSQDLAPFCNGIAIPPKGGEYARFPLLGCALVGHRGQVLASSRDEPTDLCECGAQYLSTKSGPNHGLSQFGAGARTGAASRFVFPRVDAKAFLLLKRYRLLGETE